MSSALAKAAARWNARRSDGGDCRSAPNDCPWPKRTYDISSVGLDEFLQGFPGGPDGSLQAPGLRVPALANDTVPFPGRYLFVLCSRQINQRSRLRGLGQYLTIGTTTTNGNGTRPVTQMVTTPDWRFDNGNVSWHLMVHSDTDIYRPGVGPFDSDGFGFKWTPMGLTYQTASFDGPTHLNPYGRPDFYTNLTSYTPPKGGLPYGSPLVSSLGTFYDVRFPWNASCWGTVDIEVEGPCWVTFFASVRQRDTGITIPVTPAVGTQISSSAPEEAFLQNFPNAIYWKVGGRMIWEDEECSSGGQGGNDDGGGPYGGWRPPTTIGGGSDGGGGKTPPPPPPAGVK